MFVFAISWFWPLFILVFYHTCLLAGVVSWYLMGWLVLSWHDLTWHNLPSSQMCVFVSPQTISDKPIHHTYLKCTQTPHLSFLDFINITRRDLALLRWNVTTLTEDWPTHLTCVCLCILCVHSNSQTSCVFMWVSMWYESADREKNPPGYTASVQKISLPTVYYLSLLIHLLSFWDLYLHLHPYLQWSLAESEMAPAFIQAGGEESASNLTYHMCTPKCSPLRHLIQLSVSLMYASLAISLCHV